MSPDDLPPPAALTAITAIVLAAGAGTRMRSALPKVEHPLCGRPLLLHVIDALREAGIDRLVIVTGHQEERVQRLLRGLDQPGLHLSAVTQAEQRGTGHAVLQARDAVGTGRVLVVNGDLALIRADQIRLLLGESKAKAAIAVAAVPEPHGLGRIVRDEAGGVAAIVEEADADPAVAAVTEVNLGIYAFDAAWLWSALGSLAPSRSGEIYLTDAIALAARDPGGVRALRVLAPDGRINIEDRRDLARAEGLLRKRIIDHWLSAGVTVVDPATTYIDAEVRIGADTVLEPGTHLRGATQVGGECRLGPNTIVRDTTIGDGCTLVGCSIEGAVLGARVAVGPYSTLRPGTRLDDEVQIGTHAETKNAHLGARVHMGHFSYVGDAEVGADSNIGAGAITCNFDGAQKHRTIIGKGVFIGSDSLLIAPIEIGDGAATGAGAVVNHSVPPGGRVAGHPARAGGAGWRGAG